MIRRIVAVGTVTVIGLLFVAAVAALVVVLLRSNYGEIAGALGSVVGGMIGASGAAVAVYLTLAAQRQEDRTRINGAVAQEVMEFARMVVGRLQTCESIRAGAISLPAVKLAEAMEMPQPIIYPAVADKVGLLVRPQCVVAFYARIVEIGMVVRAFSRVPLAEAEIIQKDGIENIVATWADIAYFAELIITDAQPGDNFDQAVKDSVLRDLRDQLALARR